MAGDPLVLSPMLRPWLKAGLSALLLNSEERAAELRATPRQEPAARLVGPDVRRPGPVSPTSTPSPSRPAGRSNASPAPSGHVPTSARNARPAVSGGRVLPPEAWPPGWLALKNRRPLPPRPLVFWTYAGLGDDLMGTPDAARQQVIVHMLKELRHPGGTHVFWPYALPDESDRPSGPDAPSLFWSGVALLRPRALLLFGSEARDALGMPKSLVPYCQDRVDGRLVIQLPQPGTLAGKEDAFRRALAFLSRLLAFCAPPGA